MDSFTTSPNVKGETLAERKERLKRETTMNAAKALVSTTVERDNLEVELAHSMNEVFNLRVAMATMVFTAENVIR